MSESYTLPWRALRQRDGVDHLEISDEGGLVKIADVYGDKRSERADLIVRAVNSHPGLIEVLEEALNWFEKSNDGEDGCNYLNGDSEKYPGDGQADAEELEIKIRHAIEAAT